MNTIVVFDLGKVLVDFDYSIAARRIAARSTQPPENLHAFLSTSPLLVDYENGALTRQEFFDAMQSATGFQGGVTEFGQFFADIFTEIAPMIELHADLRRRGALSQQQAAKRVRDRQRKDGAKQDKVHSGSEVPL